MKVQSELWIVLSEDETVCVWEKVDRAFHFNPSINNDILPFQFTIPVDVYDISHSPIYNDDEKINEIIKSAFIECMGDDAFMYALDWQHTCFRYNPRIETVVEYPVFIPDERYGGGGYNIYFPAFYPNGDYYYLIAKDFRWGYLTHPWLHKAWVFGDNLMRLFQKYSDEIGYIKTERNRQAVITPGENHEQ